MFQDILDKDLEDVFFNTKEFASIHNISGKEVPIIIDEDEVEKRRIQDAEGIFLGEKLILVQSKYFERKPVEGRTMSLDGKEYFVISCKESHGLYEILLEVNDK